MESETASFSQTHNSQINILVVEDDAFAREFLTMQVRSLGHTTHKAGNGQEALSILECGKDKTDVVIMDLEMPVMDGLTAVRHMKNDPVLKNIPVIIVTAADKPEEMEKGLEAGVFYYLTKPVQKIVLHSVLHSAVRAAQQNKALIRELKQHRDSFHLIDSCKFQFSTLEEAEGLAVFLSSCFPVPARALPGLGELLINAIEHGNLSIGYDKKAELINSGIWRSEVDRIQQNSENSKKFATATIARKDNGIYVVIEDQGDGFDWKKYMLINPASAGNYHGRGIARARAISFDKLTFNEKGNQAVGFIRNSVKPEW